MDRNKPINEMTVDELKILHYDALVQLENAQKIVQQINALIGQKMNPGAPAQKPQAPAPGTKKKKGGE